MHRKLSNLSNIFNYPKTMLFIIMVFGLFLRLLWIDKSDGLWTDEMISYFEAKQSFPLGILHSLYNGNGHMPLYFFILHFWMKLFGNGDVTLRLLSVVFGVLIIPVAYLTGKELSSKRTGIILAALCSLNSFLIYYSQEVRFYSLLALLSYLSALFLLRIKNNPDKKNYIALILINTAIIYTFPIGIIFIFVESLVMLIFMYFNQREKIKNFIISQLITFGMFLPYLTILIHHFISFKSDFYNSFEWYNFKSINILSILLNWFSPVVGIYLNSFPDFIKLAFSLQHGWVIFVFCIIRILIASIIIINALSKKDFAVNLFTMGLVFFVIEIILSICGYMPLLSRHSTIALIFVGLVSAYGLSKIENKKAFTAIFSYILITNLIFLTFSPVSALKLVRDDPYKIPANLLNHSPLDKNDFFIMPQNGYLLEKYYNKSKLITLNDDLEVSSSTKLLHSLNKKNSYEKLRSYIISKNTSKPYENYIKQKFIDKIRYGEYTAIIRSRINCPFDNYSLQYFADHPAKYNKTPLLSMLESKNINDLLMVSFKYLTPIYIAKRGVWEVYVFKN